MDNLIINQTETDKYLLLTIEGTINSYTYGDFKEKIYSSVKNRDIVLDLSKVTNLSSSGLGVLMSAYDDSEETGNKIFILNPSEVVRMAIDSTGFSDMFNFIHSMDEL